VSSSNKTTGDCAVWRPLTLHDDRPACSMTSQVTAGRFPDGGSPTTVDNDNPREQLNEDRPTRDTECELLRQNTSRFCFFAMVICAPSVLLTTDPADL
jgi:hypothetical protein